MNVDQIILRPVITEKSAQGESMKEKKYTFLVNSRATKIDVKNGLKRLYGVDVQTVRIINTAPKMKQTKYRTEIMKRKPRKKAIVTLKEKQSIDIHKLANTSKK